MKENIPDIEGDKKEPEDRNEGVILMEPLLISESSRQRGELADLLLN